MNIKLITTSTNIARILFNSYVHYSFTIALKKIKFNQQFYQKNAIHTHRHSYILQQQIEFDLIKHLKDVPLRTFSLQVQQLWKHQVHEKWKWDLIHDTFLERANATQNYVEIRSFAKIHNCLVLSPIFRRLNPVILQQKILPWFQHAKPTTFSQLVISTSRLGPFSQKFLTEVKKYYQIMKPQMNKREIINTNYTIVKNKGEKDPTIERIVPQLNVCQITIYLRTISLTESKEVIKKIFEQTLTNILRSSESMGIQQISHLFFLYAKYHLWNKELQNKLYKNFSEMSSTNIKSNYFLLIWYQMPDLLNQKKIDERFFHLFVEKTSEEKRKGKIYKWDWKAMRRIGKDLKNKKLKMKFQELKQVRPNNS